MPTRGAFHVLFLPFTSLRIAKGNHAFLKLAVLRNLFGCECPFLVSESGKCCLKLFQGGGFFLRHD